MHIKRYQPQAARRVGWLAVLLIGLLPVFYPAWRQAAPATPYSPYSSSPSNDIVRRETVFNTDLATAGFGGLRNIGTGTITLSSVSGRVTKALLYWHGPTNSADAGANAVVQFAGQSVTGVNIGLSADNNWGFTNSQAYRADVTTLVSGNGAYTLANFRKPNAEINGASLIVFFDDGNNANNRDVVIFEGNDSNQANSFDADGWNIRLEGINYNGGQAGIELHVSDGQTAPDDALILNSSRTLVAAGGVFQGNTVPNGASAATTNGGLWDIRAFDVTSALTIGANTVTLTTSVNSDFLSLIVALINLPAGAAPPDPPPTGPCGALDVAFVIDDTGSMGPALANVKQDLLGILETIVMVSGGDYRLALLSFKDDVNIRENFAPNNRATIEEKIRALTVGGGGSIPEASDEALNTVINALPATGRRQNVDFTPAFRDRARKVVILVTDALPGGFDDRFVPGEDDVNANRRAQEAAAKGIRISAIFVPTGDESPRAIMRNYAAVSGGAFIETARDGAGTGAAIMGIVTRCGEPPPPTDLAVTIAATPNPVIAGNALTYNINLTNNGPNTASDVVLTTAVPAVATFQALSAPPGWTCRAPSVGGAGEITCTNPALAPGAAAFTLTVNIVCRADSAQDRLAQTASVRATNDRDAANNTATAEVMIQNPPGQVRLTLAGGKSAFDFGTVAAARVANPAPPSDTFTIENSGCAPLRLRFAINRTGNDVTNGRITNPDDTALFPLRLINPDGAETPLLSSPGAPPVLIPGGQTRSFRVQFNPLIPILAGRTTELFANQVVPDVISSQLQVTPDAGAPWLVNLTGRIATPAQLTHPDDASLEPLIVFTLLGDEFTVECTTHDANLDLALVSYQFLDQNDRPFGQAVRVNLVAAIAARGLVRGQSFTIGQKFGGAARSPEIKKVQVTLFDGAGSVTTAPAVVNTNPPPLTTVSAASFAPAAVAGESIVAAFGSNLAAQTLAAPVTPLPTTLAGTTVQVRDGAGAQRLAPLFFVAPGQINYQVPAGTMVGAATVTVLRNNSVVARSGVQVAGAAPGLFAANANGQGAASAVAVRADGNGGQQFEPVAQFNLAQQRFVTRPLEFGSSDTQLYLVLFGTGLRYGRANATARIGGLTAPVLYAGPQGDFVGLDQVNLLVPRELAGRGEVDVTVTMDGRTSNTVLLRFGGVAAPFQAFPAASQPAADSSARTMVSLPRLPLPTPTLNRLPRRASNGRATDSTREQ